MNTTLKYLFASAILIMSINEAKSQSFANDGLLFSQPSYGTSARIQAMGGAQMATGGDISSLFGNPAGLGIYTRSSFVLSPQLINNQNTANYFGTNTTDKVSKLGVNQIGVVFNAPSKRQKGDNLTTGWINTSFGLGYSKTGIFTQNLRYDGVNPTSSITDFFSDVAQNSIRNGAPTNSNNPFQADGNYIGDYANSIKLIDYRTTDNNGKMVSPYYRPVAELGNNQSQISNRNGSQSDFSLGFGSNYSNKIFIGGSLNFANINYIESNSYNESGGYDGSVGAFRGGEYDLLYNVDKAVKGSGINLKLGIIGKVSDDLRVGFNFVSPTWYNMNQTVITEMGSTLRKGTAIKDYPEIPGETRTSPHEFSYRLRTPYKLSGGLSYVVAKRGIISADVDFVDYTSMVISSLDEQNVQTDSHNDIMANYKANFNVRVGGEVKLTNDFMLRAGYAYNGSPYKSANLFTQTVTGGLGYKINNINLDLTYSRLMYKYQESPYSTFVTPIANVNSNLSNLMLSVGVDF